MIKSVVYLLLVFVAPALLVLLLWGVYIMYQWLFTMIGIPHQSELAWIALVVTAGMAIPVLMIINDDM